MFSRISLSKKYFQNQFINPTMILSRNQSTKKNEWACFAPICNLQFKTADIGAKCDIADFLKSNYFAHDPLMILSGVGGRARPDGQIMKFLLDFITEKRTILAQSADDGIVIGVMVSHVITPNFINDIKQQIGFVRKPASIKYLKSLAQLEERAPVFQQYNTDKILNIDALAVHHLFRRRQIAQDLLNAAKIEARKSGVNLIRFTTSNVFGSKAARNPCVGMKMVYKNNPSNFRDEIGNPLFEGAMCRPHKEIEIYIGSSVIKNVKKQVKEKKEPQCDMYPVIKRD